MFTCYKSGLLPTSNQTILTMKPNQFLQISAIWVCEVSGNADTITLKHTLDGQSSSSKDDLFSSLAVAANSTTTFTTPIYMKPGDILSAFASTASRVNVSIYGRTSG